MAGGMLIDISDVKNGYATICRLTPCGDACGPENLAWVDGLVVFGLDDLEMRKTAAESCGWQVPTKPKNIKEWLTLISAYVGYGYYDPAIPAYMGAPNPKAVLCVGKDDEREYARNKMPEVQPTHRIRSNANVKNWLIKFARNTLG